MYLINKNIMNDNYCLIAWTSHPELAQEIANNLWKELSKVTIKKFSCGEIYVNYEETVRGKDVFIIQTTRTGLANDDFVELFLLCDAAKRSFAARVHVIIPYYSYSRQDKIHASRESVSSKLMADLLVKSWADRVITMHLHSDQTMAFFDVPVDNLNARKILIKEIQDRNLKNPVIVSPDAGGAKMAKKIADDLWYPLAIMHKTRPQHNVSEINHVIWDIKGKTPIIVDDMIDTAWSVCGAKKALIDNDSLEDVYLVATHPIFSGPAIERFKNTWFKEVLVTNTLPLSAEQQFEWLTQISVAPLISNVIKHTMDQTSVSKLYF